VAKAGGWSPARRVVLRDPAQERPDGVEELVWLGLMQ
jgi:hypothetical protein